MNEENLKKYLEERTVESKLAVSTEIKPRKIFPQSVQKSRSTL